MGSSPHPFAVILAGGYTFLTSAFCHTPSGGRVLTQTAFSVTGAGQPSLLRAISDSPPAQVGVLEQGFCPAGHCRKASHLAVSLKRGLASSAHVASVVIDELSGSNSC